MRKGFCYYKGRRESADEGPDEYDPSPEELTTDGGLASAREEENLSNLNSFPN
jgi:hypothetical protein